MSTQIPRDRPAQQTTRKESAPSSVREAAPEVLVTDAMVAAGVDAMSCHYLDLTSSPPGDSFEKAAAAAFRAMVAAQTIESPPTKY